MGIWRGVEFEEWSKGFLLLQLSTQHQPNIPVPIETVKKALYPGDASVTDGCLTGTIYNILGKFRDVWAPFHRVRKWLGIIFFGDSDENKETDAEDLTPDFQLDAEFLDQPLVFSEKATTDAVSEVELTSDNVVTLGLRDDAEALLAYLMKHEGATKRVSDAVTTTGKKEISLSTAALVAEINEKLAHTGKKVTLMGHMLRFADKE